MTIQDLKEKIASSRAYGSDDFVLIVPQACYGRRARVFPGVTGEVLGPNGSGTAVRVTIKSVERFIASVANSDVDTELGLVHTHIPQVVLGSHIVGQ